VAIVDLGLASNQLMEAAPNHRSQITNQQRFDNQRSGNRQCRSTPRLTRRLAITQHRCALG
jgi:hypothetical protein